MFCYNCGNQVNDNVKYCPKCGALLREDDMIEKNNKKIKGNVPTRNRLLIIGGIVILLCSVLLILYVCFPMLFTNKKQEILLEYINNDIEDLVELETELLESYESVTGSNYENDAITYNELSNTTIYLARELNDEAVDIAVSITDDELVEVHKLYVNCSNKYLNAITLILSALENQDYELAAEANELLNEGNNYGIDFRKELRKLADKYHVELDS